jgi:hypothetical protein
MLQRIPRPKLIAAMSDSYFRFASDDFNEPVLLEAPSEELDSRS